MVLVRPRRRRRQLDRHGHGRRLRPIGGLRVVPGCDGLFHLDGVRTAPTVSDFRCPDPPPVTLSSVKLVFGKRHTVSQIRVTFSGAVNMAEVQAPGIYRLATPGKKGSFTARNAGIIRLRSAVYDTLHNMVVLTPRKAFALTKPLSSC